MPEAVERDDVLASGEVEIPVENPCPECGAPLFGHLDEGVFWQEDHITGTIHAYETDAGEIVYDVEYDCLRCEETFSETELSGDDVSVRDTHD